MTNREFVSGVMNDGKLLSKDTHIPRRHILAKGRSIADTYMAQRLDSMGLTFEYDLISVIDCFELEPVDYISCGIVDLKSCRKIMKSVKKLPETVNGRIGLGILSVTSLDGLYEFKQTSSRSFKNKSNIKYTRDKESFFIVQDGYLILPNSEVEFVRIELIAINSSEVEDCGCEENKNKDGCKTVWDDKFICPANIFTMVRDKTIQELAGTYLQIRADENPDTDENTRSSTIA